jgi:hypothetical protein
MNPIAIGVISRERLASLQMEADTWRLAHPRGSRRSRRLVRFLSGALR